MRRILWKIAGAVLVTGVLAVTLSWYTVRMVRFVPCTAILGSSGPCNGYFGGWPLLFASYLQRSGSTVDDPNLPVTSAPQLLEQGYYLGNVYEGFFVLNTAFWAIPAALIVAVVWTIGAGFLVLARRLYGRPRERPGEE